LLQHGTSGEQLAKVELFLRDLDSLKVKERWQHAQDFSQMTAQFLCWRALIGFELMYVLACAVHALSNILQSETVEDAGQP
jgi:hypothetical protein